MRINPAKIKTAKRYVELLKTTFESDLVSAFVFGSVTRGEDTSMSDIDLTAVLRTSPAASQLRKIGKTGRFGETIGRGEFRKISCVTVSHDLFLELISKRAPREGVNPLREAIILHDSGFISGLKKEVELGIISLKDDAFRDYLRYGDIRRSCLVESAWEHNKRDARSDAAKAATHYLRAYFLYKNNEMILSIKMLRKRIKSENRAIAMLYDKITEGDYDKDFVDAIREWVVRSIFRSSKIVQSSRKSTDTVSSV
ncbi:MAG: nucleotidyltransferase domain-containing protein [Candidatus Methanoperedens sp.]